MQDWTTYDVDDVAAGLQNFLICIEMFPAALAHAYAFPPRDYLDPSIQPRQGLVHSLKVMFDVRDVVDDMHIVVDDTVGPSSAYVLLSLSLSLCLFESRWT